MSTIISKNQLTSGAGFDAISLTLSNISQIIQPSTLTDIYWDTEILVIGNITHSTITHPEIITMNTSGKFQYNINCGWEKDVDTDTSGNRVCSLLLNNNVVQSAIQNNSIQQSFNTYLHGFLDIHEGDQIKVQVYQDSATTQKLYNSNDYGVTFYLHEVFGYFS